MISMWRSTENLIAFNILYGLVASPPYKTYWITILWWQHFLMSRWYRRCTAVLSDLLHFFYLFYFTLLVNLLSFFLYSFELSSVPGIVNIICDIKGEETAECRQKKRKRYEEVETAIQTVTVLFTSNLFHGKFLCFIIDGE